MDSASMKMVDWVVGASSKGTESGLYELFNSDRSRSLFSQSFTPAVASPSRGPGTASLEPTDLASSLRPHSWALTAGFSGALSSGGDSAKPRKVSIPVQPSSFSSLASSVPTDLELSLGSRPVGDTYGNPFDEDLQFDLDVDRFDASGLGVSWNSTVSGGSMASGRMMRAPGAATLGTSLPKSMSIAMGTGVPDLDDLGLESTSRSFHQMGFTDTMQSPSHLDGPFPSSMPLPSPSSFLAGRGLSNRATNPNVLFQQHSHLMSPPPSSFLSSQGFPFPSSYTYSDDGVSGGSPAKPDNFSLRSSQALPMTSSGYPPSILPPRLPLQQQPVKAPMPIPPLPAQFGAIDVRSLKAPLLSASRLQPQPVVPGMSNEAAEDGCPVLKVPRAPFWDSDGTMTVPHRVWKKGGVEKADNRHFMVMSYNVMAPPHCSENSLRYKSPSKFMDWDYRKPRILDEIAFYAPDFVCLQELPPSDFSEVFLPKLQKIGYEGHFQQKKKDQAADGCAIFYLEARFSLLAVQAFAYCDQVPADPSSDLFQRLGRFSNIALIGVFQNRHARSLRVRIVNTHLHWDPAFADTKLLQAAILMEWLERSHRDIPTVIAADLNSRPGEAVVDYLVRGKVAPGPLFADRDQSRYNAAVALRAGNVPLGPAAVAAAYANVQRLQHPVAAQSVNVASSSATPGSLLSSTPVGTTAINSVSSLPQIIAPAPPPLLRNGTKLASAYDRKDLPFTHKTPDHEGAFDHILYTSGTLSIRDVLADFEHSGYTSVAPPVSENATDSSMSDPRTAVDSVPSPVLPSADGTSQPTETTDSERTPPLQLSQLPDSQSPTSGATTDPLEGFPPLGAVTPVYPPIHLAPIHHGYLSTIDCIPTEHVPSDHLPLIAWLKWKTVPVGTGPMLAAAGALGAANRNRAGPTGASAVPASPSNGPPVPQMSSGSLTHRRYSQSTIASGISPVAPGLNGFGAFPIQQGPTTLPPPSPRMLQGQQQLHQPLQSPGLLNSHPAASIAMLSSSAPTSRPGGFSGGIPGSSGHGGSMGVHDFGMSLPFASNGSSTMGGLFPGNASSYATSQPQGSGFVDTAWRPGQAPSSPGFRK
ncbi:hypothetical protein DFJ73DRAFT_553520 [Zopfochytrium polystomum]|nr:hypothetical protein DFJ73DRAFT_553520 [Zopfochytrium polystomum]